MEANLYSLPLEFKLFPMIPTSLTINVCTHPSIYFLSILDIIIIVLLLSHFLSLTSYLCIFISLYLSYLVPTVTTITPPTLPTSGGRITIGGTNFGTNTSLISVTVGGNIVCSNIAIVADHTSISCDLPGKVGVNLPVSVTVDGLSNNVTANGQAFSYTLGNYSHYSIIEFI